MRKVAKLDANHSEIVAALRSKAGCTVCSLAQVGGGCPDIIVGYHGRNILMEIKDGSKVPSQRRLTRDEIEWHVAWNGQVAVVESVDEAIAVLMGKA